MIKVDWWLKRLRGFDFRQMDICDSRVAFATENVNVKPLVKPGQGLDISVLFPKMQFQPNFKLLTLWGIFSGVRKILVRYCQFPGLVEGQFQNSYSMERTWVDTIIAIASLETGILVWHDDMIRVGGRWVAHFHIIVSKSPDKSLQISQPF